MPGLGRTAGEKNGCYDRVIPGAENDKCFYKTWDNGKILNNGNLLSKVLIGGSDNPKGVQSTMLRSVFLFAAFFGALIVPALGANSSPGRESGLIFHAPFDGKFDAVAAAGKSKGTPFGKTEGYFVPGLKNQGLLIGADDEGLNRRQVKYEGIGNISAARGTSLFWFKPVSWKNHHGKFQHMFSAYGDHGFHCYQMACGQFGIYEGVSRKSRTIRNRCTDWPEGVWRHCAVVWDEDSVQLYLDGEPAGSIQRDAAWKKSKWPTLSVGAMGWGPKVVRGYTVIDELKIYDRPLSAAEIMAEYKKLAPTDAKPAKSLLRVGKSEVVIDGKVTPGEYAVSGNGFSVLEGSFSAVQGTWHFSCDGKYLYAALQTPISSAPIIKTRQRDGAVYSDESMELNLSPDDKTIYQIIVNPLGVVYDCLIEKKRYLDWNLKDLKVGSRIADGQWTCELAVPLRELRQPENGVWHFNIGRAFSDAGAISRGICLAPVRRARGFLDREKYMALIPDSGTPHYSVNFLDDLNLGKVRIAFSAPDASKIRVAGSSREHLWLDEKFSPVNGKAVLDKKISAGGKLITEIKYGGNLLYRTELLSRPPNAIQVQYVYADRERQKLHLAVKNESKQTGVTLIARLKCRGSGKTAAEKKFSIHDSSLFFELLWDVASLPPGDYYLECTLLNSDGRKSGGAFTQFFRKPGGKEIWRDNRMGIFPGEIPPPWIPIKAEGSRIDCKMQSYRFGENLLPVWFGTHDRNLLARPGGLIVNGRVIRSGSFKITDIRPDVVTAEAAGTLGPLQIKILYRIEYDGMIWMKLLLSGNAFPLKSLELHMPLSLEESNLVYGCEEKNVGLSPDGGSGVLGNRIWNKNLYQMPAFWIGGNNLGLCWFAENLKNWSNRVPREAAEVVPMKNERLMKLRLVDLPVTVNGTLEFEFGLQGSPVKPPRNLNGIKRWNTHYYGRKYFDYHDPAPEFFNREQFEKGFDLCVRKQKNPYFHYCSSNGFSPYAPEWIWYCTEWIRGMVGAYTIETVINSVADRNYSVWTLGCLNVKSFRDFKTWQIGNLINSPIYHLPNLYNDCVGPLLCGNAAHGCGWRDRNGTWHSSLNVLGVREFHKRMYHLGKKKDPRFLHVLHVTGKAKLLPVNAFADAVIDGESFFNDEIVDKESYYSVFTPAMFRANYQTSSLGFDLVYIPQLVRAAVMRRPDRVKLWRSKPPAPPMLQALRHFCGYALVHNVMIWPWDDWTLALCQRLHSAEKKHLGDFNNLKFISYWEKEKPYTVSSDAPSRVMVSALTRGRKAVFFLMNDTDSARKISVKVDVGKMLGGKKMKISNFEPEFPAAAGEGSFSASLPPRSFAVYFAEPDL